MARRAPTGLGAQGTLRILVLAIVPWLAGCGEQGAEQQKAAVPQPPIPVGVVQVVERATNPGLTFVGRVQAVESVDLTARVQGFLTRRAFEEGQTVKEGDLLFVIEKGTYQADVDAAEANVAKAEADAQNALAQLERTQTLFRQKTVSQATLDDRLTAAKQTDAVVAQAKAALEQAKINLGYTEIHAPFAGRIGRSAFSVGAWVGPSSGTLATIVSQDPIYVTFPVSDRTILELTENQRAGATAANAVVHLTLSTGAAYPQTGSIDFTGIKIDPNTDTLMVRAQFPNPKGTLVDGQFVQVLAESKNPVNALVIPQKAVLTDQSGSYVMLVGEGNKAVQRSITVGANIGTDVVVQNGLKAGETVITDGLQRIRPGQAVDPGPATPPPGQDAQPTGK